MPRRKHSVSRRRPRRRGGSFSSFMKKAHDWIREKRVISRTANALGRFGVPYAGLVGKATGFFGYGRGRGGALRPSGGALKLAGGRR
jgi:hypothetical protein